MPMTQVLALGSVGAGALLGLLVLGVAVVAGRRERVAAWLGGTVWGVLAAGLMLTDCLHAGGPGPVSELAFPVFFSGLLLWPALLVWGQDRWYLRWPLAQLLLLLALGPAFVVATAATMCTMR